MATVAGATADFRAQKRIAIAGVSRNAKAHSGNAIYDRLRSRGYEVFAVNPNADEIDGKPCFRSLAAIPGGVDAVVRRQQSGDGDREDARREHQVDVAGQRETQDRVLLRQQPSLSVSIPDWGDLRGHQRPRGRDAGARRRLGRRGRCGRSRSGGGGALRLT